MVSHRLIGLLVFAALTIPADAVLAQSAFPAPLPGQGAANGGPPLASPLPGVTPDPASECMKAFYPLREDAEKKGKLIKAASDRHAGPDEACQVIKNYSAAELMMLKYVESNATKCGIPAQVADQLKAGHKNTEGLEQRICAAAEQAQRRGPPLPVGDFPDSSGTY